LRTRGLIIFDAFNTLVTSRPGYEETFLGGLTAVNKHASSDLLTTLQVASEGLDHSSWSTSRRVYSKWTAGTLASLAQAGAALDAELAPRVVPALEQLHQAPMVALPDAADCLATLKGAGFTIALCSNWGWDLADDLADTGLTGWIDVLVTSAQAGYRKPHPRIYQETLGQAGFSAADAVFVGDSLRTDALGPQRVGIRSVLLARGAQAQIHTEQVTSLAEAARLLLGWPTG
jgi:HAD superfamily hydrolase (TIGR01509 family)